MNKAQNLLRLNFSSFDKSWVLNYAYTQLRDGWALTSWKKEIFYFIIDWLSESKTIKVTTSGSTGKPKTLLLYKEYVKRSAEATNLFFDLKKGDKALLCLPVKYIAGKLMIVRALEGKYNLFCVEPSLTPLFDETFINFSAMTPAQVSSLLSEEQGRLLLDKIDKLIIGGDRIPTPLEKKLQTINTKVWHTYGMTETITHIALRKVNGYEASSWFIPMEHVSLSRQNRQMVIDAPAIGVHQMLTNDVVELNQDGSFIVLGRKDNVVISGGIKLFPEAIENKLEEVCKKPFYFLGVSDNVLGCKLVMYVESDEPIDVDGLKKTISMLLDKYEMPKDIIVKKHFKKTISNKIIRE
ncbi:MAG: O-succinylbenzoic acid--CoA ligase [Bacteroidetes bacterium]|nr:MAG: O-succinylbenzoic acid--CoA ligase [Bacteroidota bacterium]